MRIAHLFAIISALMLSGCARTPAILYCLPPPDRNQTEATAMRYLLFTYSDSGTKPDDFQIYHIDSGELSRQLIAVLTDHKQPLTAASKILIEKGQAIDMATRQPLQLWSVQVEKIAGDNATAKVSCYSSDLVASGQTLLLRQKDGHWLVVSVKLDRTP